MGFINSLIVKAQATLITSLDNAQDNLNARQEGQALIEYGLIAALVGVALVAGLGALKGALYGSSTSVFDRVIAALS